VVVIVVMPLVKGDQPNFQPAVLLLSALLAFTTAMTLFAPETSVRRPIAT